MQAQKKIFHLLGLLILFSQLVLHASEWEPTTNVSGTFVADTSNLPAMDSACDSFGNQVIVWSGINPTTNHIVIYSAFRPVSGLWETPVQISSNPTTETVEIPKVCISDDGKITAVWFHDDGTNVGVRAAERTISSS